MELVANHLWQSTICLAVAALLTLALRRNRARVRYAIWVAASVKFIVPFAPLVAVGRQFGWRTSVTVVQPVTVLLDTMSRPFSRPSTVIATTAFPATGSYDVAAVLPLLLLGIWLSGSVVILLTWYMGWRRLTNVVRNASPIRHGHELEILRRLEARAGIRTPTTLVSSNTSLEPGVFGLMKPVLLWPRGIAERLTADQIEALLAHEVCHVRRRDNLVAAVHMIVEALFWFHPLVWWISARDGEASRFEG
jgi:beta-lactamase regulating signal transducer with metallopeptidase domain